MAQLDDGTGTAPYSGGGSGAAGGTSDVELTFADVEKIGQDTAALSDDATAAKSTLAGARGHAAAFGSYAPARAVYAHHQAVVDVFEETLAAITKDLDDFGNTIVQAVHAYEQTDQDAAASLAAVAAGLDPRGVHDTYVDSRNKQGEKLDNVEIDDPAALAGQHPDLDPDAIQALKDAHDDDGAHDTAHGIAFQRGGTP